MSKKLKGGPFGTFQHPFCRKTSKNWREILQRKTIFRKKSLTMLKKSEREDPLVSTGIVCYAEKHKILFWFSSLSQMFQFGTIKFLRTFKNYFGQLVWIEKKSHYNSRVSFHEAPAKNEGGPFGAIQNLSKKSLTLRKKSK